MTFKYIPIDWGFAFAALLMLCTFMESAAQQRPDAGSILQKNERDLKALPTPAAPKLQPLALPEPMSFKEGIKFTITKFNFSGNSALSNEKLQIALSKYLGASVNFDDLQEILNVISKSYGDNGFIAKAYLPEQDVTEGTVTVQIIEGILGEIIFEGKHKRVPMKLVQKIIQTTQIEGNLISTTSIDESLIRINEIPGTRVEANLSQGKSQNETNLVLNVSDSPLVAGDISMDNTGSRSTGPYRVALNGYVFSPAGYGDFLSSNFFHTEGIDYLRLAYTFPTNDQNLRLGFSGSLTNFSVISSDLASLGINGKSETVGLEAAYSLIKKRELSVNLTANIDYKTFRTNASGETVSDYSINAGYLTLSLQNIDAVLGGGSNSASIQIYHGHRNLGSAVETSEDDLLKADFDKFKINLSREQALTKLTSILTSLSLQFSRQNLDSSEKMYLGGSYGIRAYPTSEGGGSEGQLATIELRTKLTDTVLLSSFYDYGHVKINTFNDASHVTSVASVNNITLQGIGQSLAYYHPTGFTAKAVLSHRIGHNPLTTTAGKDSDGSLIHTRLWLTLSQAF